MVCPMRLSISPCALQQDLVIYPVYREQFASTDPKPPARLSPSPTPLQPQSLCCVRRSVCVCRYVGRCHMLGFTCKRCPSCLSFSLLLVSNLLTLDLISTEQQHHPVKHNKPPPESGLSPADRGRRRNPGCQGTENAGPARVWSLGRSTCEKTTCQHYGCHAGSSLPCEENSVTRKRWILFKK